MLTALLKMVPSARRRVIKPEKPDRNSRAGDGGRLPPPLFSAHMTRSNREFTETIQTAQDWASSRIDEIIEKMRKVPYVEMQLIWKESWGTGYAAELLAPHWKIDSSKALHIGLLADIGMLILSQLVNF